MDPTANIVHLSLPDSKILNRFFVLLCRVKGYPVQISKSDDGITHVTYRKLRVDGLHPVINYLNDIIPHPELLPGDLAQRSLLYSFADGILDGWLSYQIMADCYEDVRYPYAIRSAQAPTLLDIAIVAARDASNEESPRWVNRLAANIGKFILENSATNDEEEAA